MAEQPFHSNEPQQFLAENFDRYRSQLRRSIAGRMGSRMRQRVDPSDILQEAYMVALRKVEKQPNDAAVSFFVWMKTICHQTFSSVFEKHFKSQKRSVNREQLIGESFGISNFAIDASTSPSGKLARHEEKEALMMAIDSLKPNDRQVLYLRMIEQLSTDETAERLGISVAATKKRHIRAFRRLVEVLKDSSVFER